ncbi:MAG: hypothetical protein H0W88_12725 [Parachlamydiaceae bacterium]|nr:hypothetical protein [Parachlamydiaceae bacterium]
MNKLIQQGFSEGITVDLRDPLFSDGVLTTEAGGVITGPNLRIQAQNIRYTKKMVEGQPILTIEAEDELILEFGEYIFVGQKLFYDFQKKEGILYKGRTNTGPWFFGGETIELRPDYSYVIYDGYVTTSENIDPEWAIYSNQVQIFENRDLDAKRVQLRFLRYTILWIPSLKLNLDSIFDSPIRYRFRWGGSQGPRFGLTYEIFSWERWKSFIRFDYRLTRGPGGGFEVYYHSEDLKTDFQSINYISRDSSLLQPHEKSRFRFEGKFSKLMADDKVNILLTYDKVSDLEMPSNYYDRDFDFETSERTQLLVRRQEDDWIANFYTRVRVNSFQTVKQELPSFGVNFRPFLLGPTGIIFENWAKVSYLDFKYAKFLHEHDYASSRIESRPKFYKPFELGPVTATPEIGGVGLFYGDSHKDGSQTALSGFAGLNLNTQLYRQWSHYKHVIEPYISYHYYSYPTVSPKKHYIFDINDGWYHLNKVTFGMRNSLFTKITEACITRLISADLYAHAFFHSPHIHPTIPKVYSRFIFFSIPTMRHIIETAWDIRHNQLGHINVRLDWTYSDDLAIGTEYRHRDSYDWRKSDHDNFFLEAYHSDRSLRHSQVSDRRDTVLLRGFYRFHPNWTCEVSSRQGWNRKTEPRYSEYEMTFLTTIQTAWHLRFSFQHRENDNRFALYVNVGLSRPDPADAVPAVCYFD